MAILTVTNAANSGSGSLRETIAQAQSGDIIQFDSALANQTINLTSGNITIDKDITIDGSDVQGITLSGNNASRVFLIERNLNVTVKNVAFVNGRAASSDLSEAEGGAIKVSDYSTLTVENSTFKENSAGRGGAIRVGYGGSLTVRGSTFDGNDGTLANDGFSAGAIATFGAGGPTGTGKLVIEDSTFSNNKGSTGGAVYNLLGPVTIKNSVFTNNESTNEGGAIFTDGVSGSEQDDVGGSITIEGSRFEANKAVSGGGALYLWTYKADQAIIKDTTIVDNSVTRGGRFNLGRGGGIEFAGSNLVLDSTTIANNTSPVQGGGVWLNDNTASVNVTNSTISGNKALEDAGGGMFINIPDATPVNITNSTLVNNQAGRDAGAIWTGGETKNVKLTNTLLAKNSATVTKQGHTNFTLMDGGGNIVETIPDGRGPLVTATSRYVSDLKLGELQQIGNDLVHPLLPDSPAINTGTTNGAPTVDQRNVLRDSEPDVGAYEASATSPTSLGVETVDLTISPDGVVMGATNGENGDVTPVQLDFSSSESISFRELVGTKNDDTLDGTSDADRISGKAGNDSLSGEAGDDRLMGGRGDDVLMGGDDADLLRGQAGNDWLMGGLAADTLVGGQGADRFVFESSTDGLDTISDFNSTDDVIDLRQIFAQAEFAGSSDFDRFNQFLRFEQVGAASEIKIDADGNGAETRFTTLATLRNVAVEALNSQTVTIA